MSSQTKVKHRIQPDLLITAEAVALDLPAASVVSRMASSLIDAIITCVTALTMGVLVIRVLRPRDEAYVAALTTTCLVLAFILLPTCVEYFSKGRSLGKFALGLQVLRDDGGPVRFRHCIIRNLLGLVELWGMLGSLALMVTIASPKAKRLGDMMAGTYVIHIPVVQNNLPLIMPPDLANWALTAQVSEIPNGLLLSCRQFLRHNSEMDPRHRNITAQHLAAQLEEYAFPPCPWGTDPERFIAAVIVSRRDHEYAAILSGEQAFQKLGSSLNNTPFDLQ